MSCIAWLFEAQTAENLRLQKGRREIFDRMELNHGMKVVHGKGKNEGLNCHMVRDLIDMQGVPVHLTPENELSLFDFLAAKRCTSDGHEAAVTLSIQQDC